MRHVWSFGPFSIAIRGIDFTDPSLPSCPDMDADTDPQRRRVSAPPPVGGFAFLGDIVDAGQDFPQPADGGYCNRFDRLSKVVVPGSSWIIKNLRLPCCTGRDLKKLRFGFEARRASISMEAAVKPVASAHRIAVVGSRVSGSALSGLRLAAPVPARKTCHLCLSRGQSHPRIAH